ncbi:hypothetical protein M409DRAFT_22307 [Zasmidium cellare ATCC 36951]|uniref:Uncharacterized protein n=1 Tax=Zasmidium cellare ATCC 36951 TaxID=1080233 RepID=A0A6A6CP25_ZASCE|nr:uncharacterized protein M409DRAFT_22307 [Zasmidium cellare ATCC 36951]KAF2167499.1 hypothetical protein M409DRAFT_22307 [Zasmidium cellare ATCC 36951]
MAFDVKGDHGAHDILPTTLNLNLQQSVAKTIQQGLSSTTTQPLQPPWNQWQEQQRPKRRKPICEDSPVADRHNFNFAIATSQHAEEMRSCHAPASEPCDKKFEIRRTSGRSGQRSRMIKLTGLPVTKDLLSTTTRRGELINKFKDETGGDNANNDKNDKGDKKSDDNLATSGQRKASISHAVSMETLRSPFTSSSYGLYRWLAHVRTNPSIGVACHATNTTQHTLSQKRKHEATPTPTPTRLTIEPAEEYGLPSTPTTHAFSDDAAAAVYAPSTELQGIEHPDVSRDHILHDDNDAGGTMSEKQSYAETIITRQRRLQRERSAAPELRNYVADFAVYDALVSLSSHFQRWLELIEQGDKETLEGLERARKLLNITTKTHSVQAGAFNILTASLVGNGPAHSR